MTPAPKLVTQRRQQYTPTLSESERRAYAAAYKILQLVDWGEVDLACPGAIRSRRIDRIAQAIMAETGR